MAVTSSWVFLSDKKSIDVLSHRFTNDLQWLNVMCIPPNFQTVVTTVTIPWSTKYPWCEKSSATIKHQVFCHMFFVRFVSCFEVSIYTFGLKLVIERFGNYWDSRKIKGNFVSPKNLEDRLDLFLMCKVSHSTIVLLSERIMKKNKLYFYY